MISNISGFQGFSLRNEGKLKVVMSLIFLVLVSMPLIYGSEVEVGTGDGNLSITVQEDGGPDIEGVNLTLLNATAEPYDEPYEVDDQVFSLLTDDDGRANFTYLSQDHTYNISAYKRGYYPEIFGSFEVTDDETTNVDAFLEPDEVPPYIEITGSDPGDGAIIGEDDYEFNVDFYVEDDLEQDEINVSLYMARWETGYMMNESQYLPNGTSGSFDVQLEGDGNYSWYLTAEDYMGNVNYTTNRTFYLDTVDPSYTDLSIYPEDEQNSSQNVTLSAHINSTYSFLDDVRLEVDGNTVKENDTLNQHSIHDKLFVWDYELPDSSIGDTLDLRYCFNDMSGDTSEVCTDERSIMVTDNITPEFVDISPDGDFMQSEGKFNFDIEAIDNSGEVVEVNVSFSNGTHDLINLSEDTENDEIFSFEANVSDLPENNYTLDITAIDPSDNVADTSSWVVIDDTPPEIGDIEISNRFLKEGDNVTIDADISDTYNVTPYDYDVNLDFGISGYQDMLMTYVSGNQWQSNTTIDIDDDINLTVNITATDLAGNQGWNDSQTLYIDNTPIDVDMESPLQGGFYNGTYNASVPVNYTLSEQSNTSYYYYAGIEHDLPSDEENHFNLSLVFPGAHYLGINAEDSAGNIGSSSVLFYASFLMNTTLWSDHLEARNTEVDSSSWYSTDTMSPLSEMVNLSEDDDVTISISLTDGKVMNLSTSDPYESKFMYNLSLENEGQDFVDVFEKRHGTEVLDFVRMGNMSRYDLDSLSLSFPDHNASDFEDYEEFLLCKDDGVECTTIGTGSYFVDDGETIIELDNPDFEDEYASILLTNNTLPPQINITEPENGTEFESPYDNVLEIEVNEPVQGDACSYLITSEDDDTFDGDVDLEEADMGGYEVYQSSFTLPNPPYLVGDYGINISCTDLADNEEEYEFAFSIDHEDDNIDFDLSPNFGESFPMGTSEVEIEAETNELAYCIVDTDATFDDSTSMSTSDNITHTYDVSTSDDEDYSYYINCANYNRLSNTTQHLEFSIDGEDSDDDSSDNIDIPDDDDDDDDEDEEEEDDYASETFSYSLIGSGESTTFNLTEDDVALRSMTFTPSDDLSNVQFVIESFSSIDHLEITDQGLADVYRYIQILEDDVDFSSLDDFSMEFKVPEDWMEDESLDHDDIIIGYYSDEEEDWVVIENEYSGSDNGYNIYSTLSNPSQLFAISLRDEEEAEDVQAEANDTGDDQPGEIIDDGESLDEEIGQSSLSFEEVSIILSVLVGGILVSAFVYGNRKLIAKAMHHEKDDDKKGQKEKERPRRKIKEASSERKNSDGSSSDLRTQDTREHAENNYGKHIPELEPYSFPKQKVSEPTQKDLQGYLETVFKNIWVEGYNDKEIASEIEQSLKRPDDKARVYSFVKAYSEGKTPGSPSDKSLRPIVDELREKIISKHGIDKGEIFTSLSSKGWPTYMIKSVVDGLSKSMVLPLHDKVSSENQSQENVSVHDYETKELEEFISKALSAGMARSSIIEKTTSAGWPREVVDSVLESHKG